MYLFPGVPQIGSETIALPCSPMSGSGQARPLLALKTKAGEKPLFLAPATALYLVDFFS